MKMKQTRNRKSHGDSSATMSDDVIIQRVREEVARTIAERPDLCGPDAWKKPSTPNYQRRKAADKTTA